LAWCWKLPPPLALRLKAARPQQTGLVDQNVRNFRTQTVDPALEVVIEHVAEHEHAPAHPLPRAPELAMAELSLASVSVEHGKQHVRDRIRAESMTCGQIADDHLAS